MPAKGPDPSNRAADMASMAKFWNLVSTLEGGVAAMRRAGQKYLPRYEQEDRAAYSRRLENARMTNVFMDIVENLVSKPYSKPVKIADDMTEELKEFTRDVSAKDDTIHVFSSNVFHQAVLDGISFILVDYTKKSEADRNRVMTVAEEKESGSRSYWVHYEAQDVMAAHSMHVKGKEQFYEVRLFEQVVMPQSDFTEKIVDQIRVFKRKKLGENDLGEPYWEIWRKKENTQSGDGIEWERVEGPTELGLDYIPFVPVVFGRRKGKSWRIRPPLRDAAHLQVELYQQENGLKNVRELTAFPMLAGNGVQADTQEDSNPTTLVVGPGRVLYGGGSGDGGAGGNWTYVEPGGESLQFLRDDIKDTIKELRELGKQPLTAQSGNLTRITTAVAAQKGNTAIQAWIAVLNAALDRCLEITADWEDIADPKAGVEIYDGFDLAAIDDDSFSHVMDMAVPERGARPLISRDAAIYEAKRRDILSSTYDGVADLDRIDDPLPEDGDLNPDGSPAGRRRGTRGRAGRNNLGLRTKSPDGEGGNSNANDRDA